MICLCKTIIVEALFSLQSYSSICDLRYVRITAYSNHVLNEFSQSSCRQLSWMRSTIIWQSYMSVLHKMAWMKQLTRRRPKLLSVMKTATNLYWYVCSHILDIIYVIMCLYYQYKEEKKLTIELLEIEDSSQQLSPAAKVCLYRYCCTLMW